MSRAALLADRQRPLTGAQGRQFEADLQRLATGEPLAYLLGAAPFLDFDVTVGPAVLIPRPETEILAEWAVLRARLRGIRLAVDAGTGSGILAVAMARAVPGLQVEATDVDPLALEVARKNALALGVADRVRLHLADLFPVGGVPEARLLVANLPYVAERDIGRVHDSVLRYEPHGALFAGPDGLSVIRRLILRLPAAVAADADVGLEIAPAQAADVLALLRSAYPRHALAVRRDLSDRDRYVLAEAPLP